MSEMQKLRQRQFISKVILASQKNMPNINNMNVHSLLSIVIIVTR
jgi:hypothetical protein